MPRKISITGPESTGKSWLAEQLARHFNTAWAPEYSREYLESLDRPYNYNDILEIAKMQLKKESDILPEARKFLFCDTDLIVSKIWCDVKYGKCHEWIEKNILENEYELYLLCDIDLPWEQDPLREHPDRREYLFNLYKRTLSEYKLNFKIISGEGDKRLQNAINVILHSLK